MNSTLELVRSIAEDEALYNPERTPEIEYLKRLSRINGLEYPKIGEQI